MLRNGLNIVCLLGFFVASVSGAAEKIISVEIIGNDRMGADAILNKISQKKGSDFSEKKVAEDIKTLFKMEYFDRIQVEKLKKKKGWALTISVHELPVVQEITVSGNENYKIEDILGDMTLKQYEVASKQKMAESLEKLREKYKEKGYYLAEMNYKFIPLNTPHEVKLDIKVVEHEQIKIRKIFFFGNEKFTDSELKGVILSKEGNAFSWLTQTGKYHELMFEQDVQTLRFWYLDRGHVKINVKHPQTFISPDKRWITMHFTVEEGESYDFGKTSFGGDLIFTEDELRVNSAIESGALFRSSRLQYELGRLGDMYGDLGYAFTNVIPNTTIHEDTKRVDLRFDFEKGNKMHIRRILFTGNTKTYDKVMRREMRVYEGDLYSSTKVKTSKRNVNRTGYFAKVIFKEKVVPEEPSLMDVEVEIEEKPTGTLMVGAGYSSQDGFLAQGRVAQDNFIGTGQKIQFYAQIAGSRTRFSLGWDEPYLFDYDLRFGSSIYYMDRAVFSNIGLSFSELKAGGNINLGVPLSDETLIGTTYKLEHIWIQDAFNDEVITKADNEGFLSSTTISYTFDTRNNRLRPTQGFLATASSELAGLGGNLKFLKFMGNIRWYIPIVGELVYRSNLQGGAVFPMFNSPIPVSERFALGGISDLRGYRPGSVGPMICAEATRRDKDNNLVFKSEAANAFFCDDLGFARDGLGPNGLKLIPFNVGGQYELVSNTELEFMLVPKMGISIVAFLDVGTAFDRPPQAGATATGFDDTHLVPPLMRVSVGWGIRWWSPIGPLRFEFGYPLIRPFGEPTVDAQFAIAPTF
jgi:outer membrane protein insertion porin family